MQKKTMKKVTDEAKKNDGITKFDKEVMECYDIIESYAEGIIERIRAGQSNDSVLFAFKLGVMLEMQTLVNKYKKKK